MMTIAISDAVRSDFTDVAVGSSYFPSPAKQWLEHITLRHGALLGECCAATAVLNSPSSRIGDKLIESTREFGTTWGCLTRLLDELKFVQHMEVRFFTDSSFILRNFCSPRFSVQIKMDVLKLPKTSYIGFTESGLPEPTLADICRNNSPNGDISIPEICDLYHSIAGSLVSRLQDAFHRFQQFTVFKNNVHFLAEESLNLLVKEAS